ncbi:hypothetical protein DM02DRAFT_726184 [Periconia macrospinosa]|uniref:Rhodopsin domain-containing protein n=1 Tax=Periconia macrospinosa TaxID=97972 RepID=A0A2V1E0T7_9PLEO|nr:hypothetical protein DM02DRAFT_726184 [Periconia macrospinosa]
MVFAHTFYRNKGGLGLHIEDEHAIGGVETSAHFLKILHAIDLLWITTCTLTKLSALFFYTQIFYVKQKCICTCWITIGFTIAYELASCISFRVLLYTLVRKSWLFTLLGYCKDENVKSLMWGSIDIVPDSFIICTPVLILNTLQLPTAKRLGLLDDLFGRVIEYYRNYRYPVQVLQGVGSHQPSIRSHLQGSLRYRQYPHDNPPHFTTSSSRIFSA